MRQTFFIHSSAFVEEGAEIGDNAKIWHMCHIRTKAKIGRDVSVGKGCYVDTNVQIGSGTRIQNLVNVYDGVQIENNCFIGPSVVFTNDRFPRVGNKNWQLVETRVRNGAAIGAGAVIRCGIEIGAFAMIGAGAILTHDVPPFTLVLGFPADPRNRICACGQTIMPLDTPAHELIRDCCEQGMLPEALTLAKQEQQKLLINHR